MKPYIPRLWHAVALVFGGCAVLIYAAENLSDFGLTVAFFSGCLLYLFAGLVVWWLTIRERIGFYDAVTRLAERLADLDPSQWQALGIAFPSLRIKWTGKPVQFVEDSDFTVEEFAEFMADSSYHQIAPERDWTGRRRRTWLKIKSWLEGRGYLRPDSAAGNHSWLWKGNSYYHLKMRYLGADPIPNMEEPIIAPVAKPAATQPAAPVVAPAGKPAMEEA